MLHRAVVKYGSERENNTQANPFYSPMPECCDKGGLLPLPSVYDYQYVLGHFAIEQTSTGHDRTKTNCVRAPSRENIKQRCTSLWHHPSTAESARKVKWILCVSRDQQTLCPGLTPLFVCLCGCMICALPNSLILSCSDLQSFCR